MTNRPIAVVTVVAAAAVIETLSSLHLDYPEVGKDKLKELAAAKTALVKK